MSAKCRVIDHPLVLDRLTRLRDRRTPSAEFRAITAELGLLLAYESARDWPLSVATIQTPVATMDAPVLTTRPLCLVAILRAGLGLLEGAARLWPLARIGMIGLVRDPVSLRPTEYVCKLPGDLADDEIVVLDPMLATGNSASAALHRIKQAGGRRIRVIAILAAPEGVALLGREHPDVAIVTACVDPRLNDHGYIVPGLGDAGDRLYGTT